MGIVPLEQSTFPQRGKHVIPSLQTEKLASKKSGLGNSGTYFWNRLFSSKRKNEKVVWIISKSWILQHNLTQMLLHICRSAFLGYTVLVSQNSSTTPAHLGLKRKEVKIGQKRLLWKALDSNDLEIK